MMNMQKMMKQAQDLQKNMKGLVEISLVPEDREMFYVQYAFLKKSVINDNFTKLIQVLDNLSNKDGLLY